MADVGGLGLRQRRKAGDRCTLVGPRQAARLLVHHHDDAPTLRQRHAREQRRGNAIGTGPAVDEQAAMVEAGNADARAQATV